MREQFLIAMGDEVQDADEETFDLFSYTRPMDDLGMIDPKAEELELSVGDREFSIRQSPVTLQSSRSGGTTGAAVWTSSVRLAEWLMYADNAFRRFDVLHSSSTALELGSGIAGIVPCILGSQVGRVLATDQSYALKLLRENIRTNAIRKNAGGRRSAITPAMHESNIDVAALDWETDDIPSFLAANELTHGVDLVFASDTVYNYALLQPFVQTCVDVCMVRAAWRAKNHCYEEGRPTLCVVVQRLRQSEVFEQWMRIVLEAFRVWRLPDELLCDGIRVADGFVVHVLLLRRDEP